MTLRKVLAVVAGAGLMASAPCTLQAAGFDFPLGKPDASGYSVLGGTRGLRYLETHDYKGKCGLTAHPGEDWNADGTRLDEGGDGDDRGDSVYSVADGVVEFVDPYPGTTAAGDTWGYVILVRHDGPYQLPDGSSITTVWSQYGHLATVSNNPKTRIPWKNGNRVLRGDHLGTVGDYPHLSEKSYHLHFEIRRTGSDKVKPRFFPCRFDAEQVEQLYLNPSDFIAANRPKPADFGGIWDSTVSYSSGPATGSESSCVANAIQSGANLVGTIRCDSSAPTIFTGLVSGNGLLGIDSLDSSFTGAVSGDTSGGNFETASGAGEWIAERLSRRPATYTFRLLDLTVDGNIFGGLVGGNLEFADNFSDGRTDLHPTSLVTCDPSPCVENEGALRLEASDGLALVYRLETLGATIPGFSAPFVEDTAYLTAPIRNEVGDATIEATFRVALPQPGESYGVGVQGGDISGFESVFVGVRYGEDGGVQVYSQNEIGRLLGSERIDLSVAIGVFIRLQVLDSTDEVVASYRLDPSSDWRAFGEPGKIFAVSNATVFVQGRRRVD